MLARTLAQVWLLIGPAIQHPSDAVPLDWEAPLECPDEAALRDRVDRLVPGLLDQRDAARSRVDVRVRRGEAEAYESTVVIEQADGEIRRVFSAADCELLVDATALVIALALDPVGVSVGLREVAAVDEGQPEAPDELPEPVEAAEPVSEQASEPEPTPSLTLTTTSEPEPTFEPRRLRVGVRAFGGGAYGPTNTGYATIGGALALLGPRWRAELGASWAIPRVVRSADGFGGRFDGWAIFGRGCFAPTIRRLELPLCGAVEVGRVRGRGLEDLPSSSQASFVWIAPGLTQGLWFAPIDRLAFGVELDVMVPLNRGAFVIDSVEVQRIAAVAARGLAGFEFRW